MHAIASIYTLIQAILRAVPPTVTGRSYESGCYPDGSPRYDCVISITTPRGIRDWTRSGPTKDQAEQNAVESVKNDINLRPTPAALRDYLYMEPLPRLSVTNRVRDVLRLIKKDLAPPGRLLGRIYNQLDLVETQITTTHPIIEDPLPITLHGLAPNVLPQLLINTIQEIPPVPGKNSLMDLALSLQ